MNTPQTPTPAERSVQAFGIYLLLAGAALLLVPALLLAPVGLPVPADVWIRMVGLLALCLGAGDLLAVKSGFVAWYAFTVWRRVLAGLAMLGFIALGLAPLALGLFAGIDLLAAGWTAWALRAAPAPLPQTKGARA